MVVNVKETIYVGVQLDLKVIIVKLVEDHHKDQHVQEHAVMELVNLTTRVSVIPDGLENCVIKINRGLKFFFLKQIFSETPVFLYNQFT